MEDKPTQIPKCWPINVWPDSTDRSDSTHMHVIRWFFAHLMKDCSLFLFLFFGEVSIEMTCIKIPVKMNSRSKRNRHYRKQFKLEWQGLVDRLSLILNNHMLLGLKTPTAEELVTIQKYSHFTVTQVHIHTQIQESEHLPNLLIRFTQEKRTRPSVSIMLAGQLCDSRGQSNTPIFRAGRVYEWQIHHGPLNPYKL